MRILDRYIFIAIAAAFLFGIAMFMSLLMAMDLMKQLVELIAEKGVPAGTALTIFAYRIPSMLAYAFPMSVLLSILLVFNRMSSESEMVAIRAGGTSFARIIVPALVFAVIVTGMTFLISDVFAPFASKRATALTQQALQTLQERQPIKFLRSEGGEIVYSVEAANLDMAAQRMGQVSLTLREGGVPAVFIYADAATWDAAAGRWRFHAPTLRSVSPRAPGVWMEPLGSDSTLDLEAYVLRLRESPFDLAAMRKKPEEYTSGELQRYLAHLREIGSETKIIGKWAMGLEQRFAVPFTCLVFALIGAPLGLRHHRTSSAMGLGISLLVIFSYYSLAVYLTTFGENGRMSATLAAWLPNLLGAALGIVLIARANR